MAHDKECQVAIIGGGFTGLAAAYELAKQGINVTVLEAEDEVGGLASAFMVGEEKLDRFYHHWFTNDHAVMNLIDELGISDRVEINPTNTGVYYANSFFQLSKPLDLLRFKPLGFLDRFRLGIMTIRARRVFDWKELESFTAHEWLKRLGGSNVYRVVWGPLLKGKFGPFAEHVSAVWFWNKLKLRGGSRGKRGEERLAYFQGSFAALAEALATKIESLGGKIEKSVPVQKIEKRNGRWSVVVPGECIMADRVIATTALPIVADMICEWAPNDYIEDLKRIQYIGNVCLVLELDRQLSSTYWLNVNDPTFPFVGVIEHTNFERPETYGGRHIVYLSKYLPHSDELYSMDAAGFLDYALPYLKAMFPAFERSWIKDYHLWRAQWSQPIVEKHYSRLIPAEDTPFPGLHICTMAQIYPEDRGTNYAIQRGGDIGRRICSLMQ